MKIPTEENKFLSQWKYYEVARYIRSIDRVIRDRTEDGPLLLEYNDLDSYSDKYLNTGIYTSVFAYNDQDLAKTTRLGPLYFDIDSDDIELAYAECQMMYDYLTQFIPKNSVLVYFTGKKGFHIECEPVCLNIAPSNDLPKIYRYIANDLKSKMNLTTLDFSVYDPRRMWRYPNSKHQSTGLYKVLLNPYQENFLLDEKMDSILEYAKEPRSLSVKKQEFSYKANAWYAEYIYSLEEFEKKKDDPLAYFNKYGSKVFKEVKDSNKTFDKRTLMSRCSAIGRLYEQAKKDGFIEHEGRLFLCSILTYTEDSIKFLHEILSHCHDYNFDKSSAHINDWIKRRQLGIGGRPYTCERANSAGVGCGDCSLELKNKWVRIGDRFIETNEKTAPSPIRFAYKNTKDDEDGN